MRSYFRVCAASSETGIGSPSKKIRTSGLSPEMEETLSQLVILRAKERDTGTFAWFKDPITLQAGAGSRCRFKTEGAPNEVHLTLDNPEEYHFLNEMSESIGTIVKRDIARIYPECPIETFKMADNYRLKPESKYNPVLKLKTNLNDSLLTDRDGSPLGHLDIPQGQRFSKIIYSIGGICFGENGCLLMGKKLLRMELDGDISTGDRDSKTEILAPLYENGPLPPLTIGRSKQQTGKGPYVGKYSYIQSSGGHRYTLKSGPGAFCKFTDCLQPTPSKNNGDRVFYNSPVTLSDIKEYIKIQEFRDKILEYVTEERNKAQIFDSDFKHGAWKKLSDTFLPIFKISENPEYAPVLNLKINENTIVVSPDGTSTEFKDGQIKPGQRFSSIEICYGGVQFRDKCWSVVSRNITKVFLERSYPDFLPVS